MTRLDIRRETRRDGSLTVFVIGVVVAFVAYEIGGMV